MGERERFRWRWGGAVAAWLALGCGRNDARLPDASSTGPHPAASPAVAATSSPSATPLPDGAIAGHGPCIDVHAGVEMDLEGSVFRRFGLNPDHTRFPVWILALGGFRCVRGVVGMVSIPEVQLAPRPGIDLVPLIAHLVRVRGKPFAAAASTYGKPVRIHVASVEVLPEPPVDLESPPPGGCVVHGVIYDAQGHVYACSGGGNWCSAALPLPGGCSGPRTPPKYPSPGAPCPAGSKSVKEVGFCERSCWTRGYGGMCCEVDLDSGGCGKQAQ